MPFLTWRNAPIPSASPEEELFRWVGKAIPGRFCWATYCRRETSSDLRIGWPPFLSASGTAARRRQPPGPARHLSPGQRLDPRSSQDWSCRWTSWPPREPPRCLPLRLPPGWPSTAWITCRDAISFISARAMCRSSRPYG